MRQQAAGAPRGRFGKLLHKEFHQAVGDADVEAETNRDVQRFLNCFAKGSYVMPHLHPEAGKWEVFVHTDGDFQVAAYDPALAANDSSNVLETARLSEEVPLIFVQEGTWHAIAAMDAGGAVEFEFKPGPYGGVVKDKVFSWQQERPWAYDETSEQLKPLLPDFVAKLEAAKGSRASDPATQLASYQQLRPYTRQELLAMLPSGQQHVNIGNTGPGDIVPRATLLLVRSTPGGGPQQAVLPQAAKARWGIYAWLAGGPVHVGGQTVGPEAPLLELRGEDFEAAQRDGLVPAAGEGGVVLELTASQ